MVLTPNALILCFMAVAVFFLSVPCSAEREAFAATCAPTEEGIMGPFYKPDAPVRASVGTGYTLRGVVRSSNDCAPLAGAIIELWLAGPVNSYDDAHRATVITDRAGAYRFESDPPPPIEGRPPHIHLRVSAKGYRTLVTQFYPVTGSIEAVFDVVLVPVR
jgi:protocatechuate 3,4-dioxygenase beta subunit